VSGTSSSGATIRIYFEKHEDNDIERDVADMIKPLVDIALKVSAIDSMRSAPTVIT
jgi:phosphoglucomutase